MININYSYKMTPISSLSLSGNTRNCGTTRVLESGCRKGQFSLAGV